uniref:Zn(2)-C6 fungal-type domain-containing protein n=3 Tax=Bionectria ochroleuca TaxID=29856 RepID=A0A8H7TRI0_BIOOC
MPVSPSTLAHGVDDTVSSGASTTRSRPSDKPKGIRNQNACDACRDRKVKPSEPEKILLPFNPIDSHYHGYANIFTSAFRYQEKRNALPALPSGHTAFIKSLVRSEAHSGGKSKIETSALRRFPRTFCSSADRVRGPDNPVPRSEPGASGDDATRLSLQSMGTSYYRRSTTVSTGLSPYSTQLGSPEVSRPHNAQPYQSLSDFASADTIYGLLNEWFDKIHPIAPILLRRRFFRRLKNGEADSDPVFYNQTSLSVPSCLEFIEKNKLLAFDLGEVNYTPEWCIAMYNIGVAINATSSQGLSDVHGFHAVSQSSAATTYLLYYSLRSLSYIDQQLLKRLFWLLFAAAKSGDMFGRLTVGFEAIHSNWDLLRPTSLSDNELDPAETVDNSTPWHGDDISYVPGLNSLSDLFMVWHQARVSPPGLDRVTRLRNSMDSIQRIIDNLPPELRWRGGLSRHGAVNEGHNAQIANIFITSFHLRSNLVQKYGTRDDIVAEHQRIVDDLLEILYHLPQCVFNANGSSVVPKVRDIGAVYLEHHMIADNPNRDEAKEKMEMILRKLNDLDCWSGLTLTGRWDSGAAHSPASPSGVHLASK